MSIRSIPLNPQTIPPEDITSYAPDAVRRRIRKRWEKRRADSGGRSEAFMYDWRAARYGVGGTIILTGEQVYTIPGGRDREGVPRPARPRPRNRVFVRLVQPR